MSMRDLIPWARQTTAVPMGYQTRDNPLAGFRREMDRLFEDFIRGDLSSLRSGLGLGAGLAAWPNLELSETDREIRISAEVPGMSEKDVELMIEDGALTIRGEKKCETEDKDRGYSERSYGRFERRVALPSTVDEESAKASFKDGVLTITFVKSAETERGRRIPINAETRH